MYVEIYLSAKSNPRDIIKYSKFCAEEEVFAFNIFACLSPCALGLRTCREGSRLFGENGGTGLLTTSKAQSSDKLHFLRE